ncbi:30S ribosomal protein S6 [Oceanithermus sp.]
MPQYDVGIILNPNLEPAQLQLEKDMIQAALDKHQAEVKAIDEWGNRRLAYPIQKDPEGYYIFYTVEMEGKEAAPLEAELRIRDNVRRVLIVRDRPEWKTKKG